MPFVGTLQLRVAVGSVLLAGWFVARRCVMRLTDAVGYLLPFLCCVPPAQQQVLKEPKDVAQQRRDEQAAANAARNAAAFAKAEARTKMKGKNKPTRRQKKKQMNIIDEKKPGLKLKLQQEVRTDWLHDTAAGWGGAGRMHARVLPCTVLSCMCVSRCGCQPLVRHNLVVVGTCAETGVCVLAVILLLLSQERERLETAQEAKRQKLESVPRALHRLYE